MDDSAFRLTGKAADSVRDDAETLALLIDDLADSFIPNLSSADLESLMREMEPLALADGAAVPT